MPAGTLAQASDTTARGPESSMLTPSPDPGATTRMASQPGRPSTLGGGRAAAGSATGAGGAGTDGAGAAPRGQPSARSSNIAET